MCVLILLVSYSAMAGEWVPREDQGKAASELGTVYKGMPREYLENAGFTEYLLIDQKKEGDTEYLTFSDWTTPAAGDTITFVIKDGKVKDWVRNAKRAESDREI